LKASNKIFRSILTGVIGLFICYQFIKRVDHEFAFDFIPLSFITVLAIIFFIWIIFRDRKEYAKSKSFADFIPTIIGATIVLGLFLAFYILDQRDKSSSKLYCVTKIIDFNGASIDFREDGTYKLTSWCLGADYYRGKYVMQDSIITIDKSEIEKIIESNRFVVRQEIEVYEKDSIPGMDTVYQKSIYQINEEGKVIQNAIDFIVREKK
jgi:hypothetical protein